MTLFYVQNVLAKIMPGLVPDDEQEILDSIVDGPNDAGVDFIYRNDGRVVIVQSKYRGSDKMENVEDFTHFCEVLSRLHAASSKKLKIKERLDDIISDIDWETDYFYLQFLTLGKVGPAIRSRFEQGIQDSDDLPDLEERLELQLSDEGDLNEKLREALSASEVLDQEITVRFRPNPDGIPWTHYQSATGRNMFIGQVSGSELADLYRTFKYRLFSMNIRDYVGETSTNKAIIESALNRPEEFVFFNNGISAVATQVIGDEDDNALRCKRFSIINGAQTVRSLRKAQHQDKAGALSKVRVVLRILDFSLLKEHDFLADVTKYNNTQNAIKISDFRSNDPVQKDLARKFEDVVRAGKKYWYKNKRSRESNENRIPINLEEFAKTIHAFRFGADDMWGGTRYLFDISPKGGYEKVFGDPVSHLTDANFALLAGTYFVCEYIRDKWEADRASHREKQTTLHPALERRWMVYFVVAELLRLAYAKATPDLDSDIGRLSKPSWLDATENTTKACLRELYEIGTTALTQAYNSRAQAEKFRHRNWFRVEQTLDDIRQALVPIPVFRGSNNPLPKLR
ncbi:MAG TPA: AIPR family protein [Candidatus Angelobacter sp.]|nr:AIPR family protein [Candidatus Angelobacter sp.]